MIDWLEVKIMCQSGATSDEDVYFVLDRHDENVNFVLDRHDEDVHFVLDRHVLLEY
jgi:hypothetical protein